MLDLAAPWGLLSCVFLAALCVYTQGDGSTAVAIVATVEDFTAACHVGVAHIVLVRHMTSVPSLPTLRRTTLSIRGNCSGAAEPPGLPFSRLSPSQCVVQGQLPLASVHGTAGSNLWLTDLFLYGTRESELGQDNSVVAQRGGSLWLTGVSVSTAVLESSGLTVAGAASQGRLYLQGCTVAASLSPGKGFPLALQDAVASILNSTLANLTFVAADSAIFSSAAGRAGPLAYLMDTSSIWIQDCLAYNNTAWESQEAFAVKDCSLRDQLGSVGEVWVASGLAMVYSNVKGLHRYAFPGDAPLAILAPGDPDSSFSMEGFPNADEKPFKILVDAQAVATGMHRPNIVVHQPSSTPFSPYNFVAPSEPVPTSGLGAGALAGILSGAAGIALVVLGAVVLLRRKWRSSRLVSHCKQADALPRGQLSDPANVRTGMSAENSINTTRGPSTTTGSTSALDIRSGRSPETQSGTSQSAACGTDPVCKVSTPAAGLPSVWLGMPRDAVPDAADVAAERLEDLLDGMHRSRDKFLGIFVLLGAAARRRGGQGVVQFMRRGVSEPDAVVKFFTDGDAFRNEAAVLSVPSLAAHVAPVVHMVSDNTDSPVCAPCGYIFPPFIVLERGESLNEWVARVAPDYITSLFVLCHVAIRLHFLHDAGFVHRDLKPSNILWQASVNSWRLMDFGCTVQQGQTARILLSPAYAAPEVAVAHKAGLRAVSASQATDVWALGVVAFELLLGRRAFPVTAGSGEILAHLTGCEPLPWEAGGSAAADLPKLGALRKTVLRCLERDSSLRPSAAEVAQRWHGVFDLPHLPGQPSVTAGAVPVAQTLLTGAPSEGCAGAQKGPIGLTTETARQEMALYESMRSICTTGTAAALASR